MFQTSSATSIDDLILTALAIVMILIFGGAIYTFFVSIFQFIFSKGDPEKVKKAWNNIRYMILGILFSLLLLFIFPYIATKLEIPGYKQYNAQNIFKKASQLLQLLKDTNNKSVGDKSIPVKQTGGYIEL